MDEATRLPRDRAGDCPTCGRAGEPYAVSAEFYDVVHGERYHREALALAGPAAAARVGIVELGAGTGLVTDVLLGASSVPVHAVEPAGPMRAVLLSRLARADPAQRARVTVHPCPAERLGLASRADLAVCLRVIAGLPPDERRAVWRSLAHWLLPGGLLFVDRPPKGLPDAPRSYRLGEARIGADVYSARLSERAEAGRIRLDFSYLVHRDGRLLRRAAETFHQWPLPEAELDRELTAAGFARDGEPVPPLLRLRRLDRPSRPSPSSVARSAERRRPSPIRSADLPSAANDPDPHGQ
ncbi:class I SAM-dependent methyltransferase [Kitasatospora sp. NPDC052896]|uniref:class I SAM-dependent methyltransferase n=1 Tax=Kitasatospora sp. NPDC052896 TaxID=3364061 RepID=UPI0037C87501